MNTRQLAHEEPTDQPLNAVRMGTSGPVVVMLHGWGRSLDLLRGLGELLSASCRVVLVDLPGFGNSPLPHGASNDGGGWSTLDYAERIVRWLDAEGIAKCILVGHSFGGRISVQIAARYQDRIAGVVLIGSHGLQRTRTPREQLRISCIKRLVSLAKGIDGTLGTRLFQHYLAPRFGSTDYKNAGELRKTLVKTVNEDLSEQAKGIKAPTLLVWGANDTETPPELGRKYRSLIEGSELIVLPHKDHEPFRDVGAHLIATYIDSFVNSRGLRA